MNLMYCSMGNGITIADRSREEHGDYMKVAHISRQRKVKYYDNNLSDEAKAEIEEYAETANPAISETQTDQFVFAQ